MLTKLLTELEAHNKIIISDQHRSLTGYELVSEIRNTVSHLKAINIKENRVYLLRIVNNVDYIIVLFSLLLCRGTVFISSPYDPIEKVCQTIDKFLPYAVFTDKASALTIQKKINNSEKYTSNTCTVLNINNLSIYTNRFEKNDVPLEDYDSNLKKSDIAIFSSGSTGEPKAILHSLKNIFSNARKHIESIDLKQTDIVGAILPLYYSYGLVAGLFSSLLVKSHIVLHSKSASVDASWIIKKKITVLALTPFFSRTLQKCIPDLRVLTLGGDVLHSKQALSLMTLFPKCQLFSTYGLTEAGPRVATWKLDKNILENNLIAPIGIPLKGVKLSILKNDKTNSRIGELIVTTPTKMLGYYYGVEKGYSDPGWNDNKIHTGDLYEEKDNEIFFIGRKKFVIMQGGEKIFPLELESVIHSINGVIDVKVEGINDKVHGQIATAFIVADDTICSKTIKKELLRQFSHSLIPRQLEFVTSISRNNVGK